MASCTTYSGNRAALPLVYHPDDYAAGQALAGRLRAEGSSGIVYDSVRHTGGMCAAVFRPRCLSNPQAGTASLLRVGRARDHLVYEKRVM